MKRNGKTINNEGSSKGIQSIIFWSISLRTVIIKAREASESELVFNGRL